MNTKSWYGRFPRTVQEAFGPHTDPHVYETSETPLWARVAYGLVLAGTLSAIAAMVVIGWKS